jgi:hypothetical protein
VNEIQIGSENVVFNCVLYPDKIALAQSFLELILLTQAEKELILRAIFQSIENLTEENILKLQKFQRFYFKKPLDYLDLTMFLQFSNEFFHLRQMDIISFPEYFLSLIKK